SLSFLKLNPKADLKNVGVIGCAVGTGYGSAVNIARVHPGSKCAVWGMGAVGLSAILGCKQAGAETIIGVDINPDKESIAKQFGCTRFINPKNIDESLETLLQSEGGIDYAFDCIGNQHVLNTAYNSLKPWGSLTVIGLGSKGSKIDVKVAELVKGRYVLGGFFGNYKPRKGNQELVEKYLNGSLPIDGLITHRILIIFNSLKSKVIEVMIFPAIYQIVFSVAPVPHPKGRHIIGLIVKPNQTNSR
ncbi:unnamed protein product, partial [Oppiella nova]